MNDERLELLQAIVVNVGDAALEFQAERAQLRETDSPTVLEIVLPRGTLHTLLPDGTLPPSAEVEQNGIVGEIVLIVTKGLLATMELRWFGQARHEEGWPAVEDCFISRD